MRMIDARQAESSFLKLLAAVEDGSEVIIARAGRPIARLAPYAAEQRRRFGELDGLFHVPENFDDPFLEELLVTRDT